MDVEFELRGVLFRWDSEKAARNVQEHGISFERAAQIFFDPFVRYLDATRRGARWRYWSGFRVPDSFRRAFDSGRRRVANYFCMAGNAR